ncbi:hypothetical protein JY651_27005 [Pyxidicoccus parkwayensis]|uniref:Lipoprotein n=1 Tax=Pyxidicoccus parkwayensis TaxID=2813578 RepID=A0ABX7NNA2_9BACT|nr:hypothetical protein [Pyxidicoccus parkwaysis]QSQ18997.1 hypothetical protein JY651_27005 [Pyxidicoccus parkwaysis]
MSEPTPEAAAPEKKSEHPLGFLYGLIGGPLLFVFTLWLASVTGRFFYVLAIASAVAFVVGALRALLFAGTSLVTRPVPSLAVLAVLGGLGFLAVRNAEAVRAYVVKLREDPELGGRYQGDGFSIEYPQGWRQRDIDGFEVAGIRPSGTGHSNCLDNAGVMRSRRDDYTLDAYVQLQREDYGKSEAWALLEDKPATVGGLPGRELVVKSATHLLRLYVTVKDQRGFIVSTQACLANGGKNEEELLAVARSFRF